MELDRLRELSGIKLDESNDHLTYDDLPIEAKKMVDGVGKILNAKPDVFFHSIHGLICYFKPTHQLGFTRLDVSELKKLGNTKYIRWFDIGDHMFKVGFDTDHVKFD